jgi:hypothetical protein
MHKNTIIIASVLVIAGAVGYWYYKKSLPDRKPVSEEDAIKLSKITLESV